MLSPKAHKVYIESITLAKNARDEFWLMEHLLLSLLQNQDVRDILQKGNIDIDILANATGRYISETVGKNYKRSENEALYVMSGVSDEFYTSYINPGKDFPITLNPLNILEGMLNYPGSGACCLLNKGGLTKENFNALLTATAGQDHQNDNQPDQENSQSALNTYCVNLNEYAKNGKIDPVIGRDNEINSTLVTLSRRTKNNPVLVGEPGVGKTAIAEGLAMKIVSSEVPEEFQQTQLYSLDTGRLLAEASSRDDFDQRLKSIIDEAQRKDVILFISELDTAITTGAASLLKPALEKGTLRCISATTLKDSRNYKDAPLFQCFQKIGVNEPTVAETCDILKGLRQYYEKRHKISYADDVLEHAAKQAAAYIKDGRLPDTAIDLIDTAGAALVLIPRNERPKSATIEMIDEVVSRRTRIPLKNVSQDEGERLATLEDNLNAAVFDQPEAAKAFADSIILARAKKAKREKPIGSYLFTGPTGVGKTEICRQAAEELDMKLERFDMSEYMESHSVSRLIGAPPGYIGFDQGGLLTDAIDKNPNIILLLDEIEKAHPDLFNILLQIMDYGTITDHNGKKVDCSNVVLVMTTNAGAADAEKNPPGFGRQAGDDAEDLRQTAIKKLFPPEFRNRLDGIIDFDYLKPETIAKVVTKFEGILNKEWAENNIRIKFSEEARNYLANKGYDKFYGARPLKRLIAKEIDQPLAKQALFGGLKKGGNVTVVFNEAGNEGKGGLELQIAPGGKPANDLAPGKARIPAGVIVMPKDTDLNRALHLGRRQI